MGQQEFAEIVKWLPLLIPLVLIQYALLIVALIDVVRRERTKGPKWVWVLVIVLVNLMGPIVYLLFGRED